MVLVLLMGIKDQDDDELKRLHIQLLYSKAKNSKPLKIWFSEFLLSTNFKFVIIAFKIYISNIWNFVIFSLINLINYDIEQKTRDSDSRIKRKDLSTFRSTCDGQWLGRTHRIPAWRSTSAGRWRGKQGWILRSRRSTFFLVEQ